MHTTESKLPNRSGGSESKVKQSIECQQIKVFNSFWERPQTMKEVDKSTGIMRENICRYCRTFRKQEKLFPIKKRFCHVTGHRATEFTTNPKFAPNEPKQLELFSNE